MKGFLYILLQKGPPDDGGWLDPDTLPVNQDLYILVLAGILLGIYTLMPGLRKTLRNK